MLFFHPSFLAHLIFFVLYIVRHDKFCSSFAAFSVNFCGFRKELSDLKFILPVFPVLQSLFAVKYFLDGERERKYMEVHRKYR